MRNHPGFTLFEILIILSLTAALTAASTIGLSQLQSIFRLRSAGDEIRALIQLGREYALANKDTATYGVSLQSGAFKLLKNSVELSRYQVPSGILIAPASFSWSFVPITGILNGCAPCQVSLSSLGNFEVINISDNGMVY